MRSRHVCPPLLCALVVLFAPAPAHAGVHTVRLGRAPSPPAGARAAGALPGHTRLRLTLALHPRDPAALAAYARDVSTPGSPVYRRYLSVAQFAQRFGATAQQIDAVRASLRAHGLEPGPVSANGLTIPIAPTAGQAGRAFSIGLERYALSGARTAYANTSAPALDPSVAKLTQAVIGLDTLATPRPLGLQKPSGSGDSRSVTSLNPSVATGGPQPCAAAKAPGVNTADQLASAYRFSSLYGQGDLGAGQTIALYELENFAPSDIAEYQSCYGTSAAVTNVPVDGGAIDPGSGESALDIEDVIGLAPSAKILVYTGPNQNAGAFDTFAQIISDDEAQVVSTSWGLCEADTGLGYAQAESTLFEEAAAQGQSIVAATGDDGAEDCTDPGGNPIGGPAVSDPAAQPFVTAVGGTHLGSPGPPPDETVWNDTHGATGGGISAFWPMPSYQSSAPTALNLIGADASGAPCGASTFCREVPDVSADADPDTGYAVYFNGWQAIAGTSASAPLWAALLALANASPACGGTPIGFANPALYRAAGAAFAADFNDVTSGDNDFTGAGGFAARPGYDMATGLGTPNTAKLSVALCDRITVVNPGNQVSLAGTAAGLRLAAASSAGSPVSYSASGLPGGLSLDPATGAVAGTLAGPGSTTVTVVATAADGEVGTTAFQWSVRAATVKLARLRNQSAVVGKRASLKVSATVDNGRAPRYSAHGLPSGLSIDPRSGIVSGVPRRAGRFAVTALATDLSGASATSSFTWTVGHALRASRPRLTGVGRRHPRLSLTLSAPHHAAVIRTISLSLPAGLSFGGARRGVAVSGPRGASFSSAARHGVLTVKVSRAVGSVRLVVNAPAIRAGAALAHKVAAGHAGKLQLAVSVADSRRLATRLTVGVRPS